MQGLKTLHGARLTVRRRVRNQHNHLRRLSSPHKLRQSRRHTSRNGFRSISSASSCARTLSARAPVIHGLNRLMKVEVELTCESTEIVLNGLNIRGERVKLVNVACILRRMVSVIHHLNNDLFSYLIQQPDRSFIPQGLSNSRLRAHHPARSTLPHLEPYHI